MAKVDVYLKGGAVIHLDIDDFGLKLNALGEISQVNWRNGKHKPLHIQPSEVAAVIEL